MLVTVGASKGGSGKSTLAQNIASMRASKGHQVVVVDLDAQATTVKWASSRLTGDVRPAIHLAIRGKDWEREILSLRERFDVICDVGGKDTQDLRKAVVLSDKTIVPLKPSPADLDTVPDFADVVRRINDTLGSARDVSIVLNMASGSKTLIRDMLAGLQGFEDVMRILPGMVGDRAVFKKAMSEGRGVHEMTGRDHDPKATAEIEQLYREIFGDE